MCVGTLALEDLTKKRRGKEGEKEEGKKEKKRGKRGFFLIGL